MARRKINETLPRWMLKLSIILARRKLREFGCVRILVDLTVRYHAVTHETVWISYGPVEGHAARVPVHRPDTDTREYRNIKFLPGIAELARVGSIELLTSAELEDETFRQPMGRFRGYSIFDHSVFPPKLSSVDGIAFPTIGPSYLRLPSPEEQQRRRLLSYEQTYPEYAALVRVLGRRNSNDAWHLFTAERAGLFCYLTMDFKFLKAMEAQARSKPIRSLKTLVMSPEQFAERFGVLPVAPHLLSYEGRDALVHPKLSMPGNSRRPHKSYRSRRSH